MVRSRKASIDRYPQGTDAGVQVGNSVTSKIKRRRGPRQLLSLPAPHSSGPSTTCFAMVAILIVGLPPYPTSSCQNLAIYPAGGVIRRSGSEPFIREQSGLM